MTAWVKTDHCQKCTVVFTLTRRRHHCRKCNMSVCGECTASGKYLVAGFRGPQTVCIECSETPSNNKGRKSRRFHPDPVRLAQLIEPLDVPALCARMQQAVIVKDRHYHLVKYPACFVGSEAVAWMIRSTDLPAITSQALAEEFGDLLIAENVFEHVARKHGFRNKYYFYHFIPITASSSLSFSISPSHSPASSLSSASSSSAGSLSSSPHSSPNISCVSVPPSLEEEFSYCFADSKPFARRLSDSEKPSLFSAPVASHILPSLSTHSCSHPPLSSIPISRDLPSSSLYPSLPLSASSSTTETATTTTTTTTATAATTAITTPSVLDPSLSSLSPPTTPHLVLHPSSRQATNTRRTLLALLRRLPFSFRQVGVGVVVACLLAMGNFSFGSVLMGLCISGAIQYFFSSWSSPPSSDKGGRKVVTSAGIRGVVRCLPTIIESPVFGPSKSPSLSGSSTSLTSVSSTSSRHSSSSSSSLPSSPSSAPLSLPASSNIPPVSESVSTSSSSYTTTTATALSASSPQPSSFIKHSSSTTTTTTTTTTTITTTSSSSSLSISSSTSSTTAHSICLLESDHTSLPDVSLWPHRPLYIRPHPHAGTRIVSSSKNLPPDCICVNEPFEFESEVMVGRGIVRVLRAANADCGDYFDGRKRTMQFAVQGRFKVPMNFQDVVTGQEFARGVQNLPAKWLTNTLLGAFRKLSPALRVQVQDGNASYMWSPLAATAQTMGAYGCGQEPSISDEPVEQLGLLGEDFAEDLQFAMSGDVPSSEGRHSSPDSAFSSLSSSSSSSSLSTTNTTYIAVSSTSTTTSSSPSTSISSSSTSTSSSSSSSVRVDVLSEKRRLRRKKYFSNLQNLANYTFSTDLTYSWDFYQSLIQPHEYQLQLGSLTTFELPRYLNGQPIQLMARNAVTGQYLWNFELWHEKLLPRA